MNVTKQQIIYDRFKECFEEAKKNYEFIINTAKNDEQYDKLSDMYGAATCRLEELWTDLFKQRYFHHPESDSYIKESEPVKIEKMLTDGLDEISYEQYINKAM